MARPEKLVGVAALVAAAFALAPSSALAIAQIGKTGAKPDLTVNTARIAPTAAQRRAVTALGARATWNEFGTPASLLRTSGYLATGLGGAPAEAARAFLEQHKDLFKLSTTKTLELVNDATLKGTGAHAVLFAQRFGTLAADWEGLIAVGVVGGKIAYVSSSAAGDGTLTGSVKLSATEAWTAAARNVGVPVGTIGPTTKRDGWTYFDVSGLTRPLAQASKDVELPALPLPPLAGAGAGPVIDKLNAITQAALGSTQAAAQLTTPPDVGIHQGARLVAFPTVEHGVRPAWLVDVVDLRGAQPKAYQTMVDAENGAVLFRHDAVQEASDAAAAQQPTFSFTGTYTPPACGPMHPFTVEAGQKSIVATAGSLVAANDIVLNLIDPKGNVVGNSDTATSPEAVVYQAPAGADVQTGTWQIQVCPYSDPGPGPYDYVAGVVVSDASAALPPLPRPKPVQLITNNPRWAFFPSFPSTDYSTTPQSEGCWQDSNDGVTGNPACQFVLASPASPFGWDVIPRTNQPTFTTRGNNAFTAEDWLSPLTPAENRSPVSADRYYDRSFPGGNFVWTNSWHRSGCDPTALADPTRNNADVDAATTNLFVMHNRFHDFAYDLGFTEQTYNAQVDNLDNGGGTGPYPYGREDDPELGNAQAGAVTGGAPSYEGRDNANQITLNDGTPPITNQYLWQPIASGFYSPCVDGSFDLSVAGHEYTHLISNRMVGGPDASLTGLQGGAMGESWSDLDALEYLHEHGLAGKQGENPWSLGAYVTGNKQRGIRDYALDTNPLNYSDVGFDTTGPEVHADGEIWNGANYAVRQALVAKHGAAGGRRWIQLVYDAWLLEQATVTMVDARDAMLAADLMRYDGEDTAVLWHAFAQRGLGAGASTNGGDDDQPTPSFASPAEPNAAVSFVTVAKDGDLAGLPVKATVYVGDYQARVTPVADTDAATALGNTASFVPGEYRFVVQAPGYGLVKFSRTLAAGATTLTVALPTNWASAANDATASGDGTDLAKLIDDDEGTDWQSLSGAVAGKQVTVSLNGVHTLSSVRVSALLRPAGCRLSVPVAGCQMRPSGDPAQNRFTALRAFTIQTCDGSTRNCALAKNWVTAFDSPADAFPAVRPRPVAPDLTLRSFDLKDAPATLVRLVVKTNQCTGGPDFQGEQDNDPSNDTACTTSSNATQVRAAELEVVSSQPTVTASSGGTTVAVASNAGTAAAAGAAPTVTVAGVRMPLDRAVTARTAPLVRIRAAGAIRSLRKQATFAVAVTSARGSLRYLDAARGLRLKGAKVQTVFLDLRTRTARIAGKAVVGKKPVRFVATLADRHRDAFTIRLSNGYRLGGPLVRGAVRIR